MKESEIRWRLKNLKWVSVAVVLGTVYELFRGQQSLLDAVSFFLISTSLALCFLELSNGKIIVSFLNLSGKRPQDYSPPPLEKYGKAGFVFLMLYGFTIIYEQFLSFV